MEATIQNIVKANGGYITSRDIKRIGMPTVYLTRYVRKHGLRKIARGFYGTKEWLVDPYLVFQYFYPKFIYSFGSAIYLHGLGDAMPNYLEVTGPLNYRPMSTPKDDIIVHTDTVDQSYNLGIVKVTTGLGNIVKVYDREKTICDLIKHREKVEFETYVKALTLYAKSKSKNINRLMEYARIMKIEAKVRDQVEIILYAY